MGIANQHRKSIVLFYILIGYIIAQICWWIFQIIMLSKQLDNSGGMVEAKIRMLAGEFAVFFALLCGGVFFINKVFRRELGLSVNKRNFSLSITHELKTPITTTKLFIETLQTRELPEEKKQEIYQKVYSEQTRLQTLIEKILMSARMDNAEIQLSLEKKNLKEYIEVHIDKVALKQKVILKIPKDLNAKIDTFYFGLAIINLLENAGKYSPPETTIIISAVQSKEEIKLSVTDEGRGIPNEDKQKVFNIYHRLEDEETKNTTGTGLGLYLVQKIVALHKGRVGVKDNLNGIGVTFELSIPN